MAHGRAKKIIEQIKKDVKTVEIRELNKKCMEQLIINPMSYIAYTTIGEVLTKYEFTNGKEEFINYFCNEPIINTALKIKPLESRHDFILGLELNKLNCYWQDKDIDYINTLCNFLKMQIKEIDDDDGGNLETYNHLEEISHQMQQ